MRSRASGDNWRFFREKAPALPPVEPPAPEEALAALDRPPVLALLPPPTGENRPFSFLKRGFLP
jgi:hypothetical protein